ncbi:MAG: hypothetical protein DI598_09030 [Pseudopedobacter saltans]|uniref:Four helix bundle protein n=1 Tax=Pseudopedobacter saltans TaxID=151895 RepID=A0A2W5F5P2_9SPHI|nr:MAG: hypothetical protein DI598_09030 [Pseudopedobacter saltans]
MRFLEISKTSTNEVRSLLYLSVRLGFISENNQLALMNQVETIGKMLYALMKSIREKNNL